MWLYGRSTYFIISQSHALFEISINSNTLVELTRKSLRVRVESSGTEGVPREMMFVPDETYLYVKAQPLQDLHLRDHYHILQLVINRTMKARRGIFEALHRVKLVLDSLTLMFSGFKFPVLIPSTGLETGPKVLVPRDVEQVDVEKVPKAELRFGKFRREVEGSDGDVLFRNRR
jgi:hypothetical protein